MAVQAGVVQARVTLMLPVPDRRPVEVVRDVMQVGTAEIVDFALHDQRVPSRNQRHVWIDVPLRQDHCRRCPQCSRLKRASEQVRSAAKKGTTNRFCSTEMGWKFGQAIGSRGAVGRLPM